MDNMLSYHLVPVKIIFDARNILTVDEKYSGYKLPHVPTR